MNELENDQDLLGDFLLLCLIACMLGLALFAGMGAR